MSEYTTVAIAIIGSYLSLAAFFVGILIKGVFFDDNKRKGVSHGRSLVLCALRVHRPQMAEVLRQRAYRNLRALRSLAAMLTRPESWLVLAYFLLAFYYAWNRPLEPGKILYWTGALILTLGVALMKG